MDFILYVVGSRHGYNNVMQGQHKNYPTICFIMYFQYQDYLCQTKDDNPNELDLWPKKKGTTLLG